MMESGPGVRVLRNGQAEATAQAQLLAAGAPRRKVQLLPDWRPFPLAALPQPIRSFVAEGAKAIGCDPAFLALPALVVAAGLIGNTRVIALRRNWREPCVLWACTVADSGSQKSPGYDNALAPVFALQRQLHLEYERNRDQHKQAMDDFQIEKRRSRDRGESPGEAPPEPRCRRVMCSDTTIERLAEMLDDNPRGTFVASEELASWFNSFTRYKAKGAGSDVQTWLFAHGARPWIVDRKTGERRSLFIPRAAVSVFGTIQGSTLARILTPEYLDIGLAARLLFAMPPRRRKHWSELEISPETEGAYERLVRRLFSLGFDELKSDNSPCVLTFAPDARKAWIEFYEAFADEQANAHDERAAALAKLEGYTARLAMLHHVVSCVDVDSDDRRPIGTVHLEAAIELCQWFAHEAQRVYGLLSESEDERAMRRLLEWIRVRGGTVSVKELQQSSRQYQTAEDAERWLIALAEAGLGTWEDRPPGPQGGRPTRVLRVLQQHREDSDEPPDGMGDAYEGDPSVTG